MALGQKTESNVKWLGQTFIIIFFLQTSPELRSCTSFWSSSFQGSGHLSTVTSLWVLRGKDKAVDVSKRPATGLRLFLEGQKSNQLAIHLQHLCSRIIQLEDDTYK
ncbi:hypothetical protein E2562_008490 [Oryza meyeriana var. granulata]|uniref:Uncharacterized protein n=1 Tax=Oryza meyeriana var. granulata TaxID=110450 RepID=A0A6G1EJR1_9ORYZ|nr:hypothetical protein E2562_008490 [Oryza meyeriana var. granulata]